MTPELPPVTNTYRASWLHFSQRLQERHAVSMGLIEYTRTCLELADLTLDALQPLDRITRDRYVIRLRIHGQNIPCIWDHDSKRLITALTNRMTARKAGQHQRYNREHEQRRRAHPYQRHTKHRRER